MSPCQAGFPVTTSKLGTLLGRLALMPGAARRRDTVCRLMSRNVHGCMSGALKTVPQLLSPDKSVNEVVILGLPLLGRYLVVCVVWKRLCKL